MDIQCPACKKIYPEIDFSLAGRKFGCECGHKFFLEERNDNPPGDIPKPHDPADDRTTLSPVTALSSLDKAPAEPLMELSEGDPAPEQKKPDNHPAGATALIEVTCPQCEKIYSDIDASLAGSKFGCECGHKFFLEARKAERPAPDAPDNAGRDEPLEPANAEPATPHEDRPPLRPKPPDPLQVRDLEKEDTSADRDGKSPAKKRQPQALNLPPEKRKVSRAGNFIVSWILNIILIGLLISLVYFGYQAMTGELELPFEIRLQLKEEGDQ